MGTPLRVLIVEDSEDDALLLVRALRNGDYAPEFERVETATAMKAALARHPWDIIISDYSMPRFHGSDALMIARESGLDLPFIVLSGAIGEETAVEIMKAGAHDYIMKNNPVRLIPAIKRELYEGDVRRERRRAEEEIVRTNHRLREAMEKLQVSQAQLLQSAKMAAIGQLVSGVAHELNNPLVAVSLYSELLPGEVNKEKIKKFAWVINQQTDRAINIVNNLLAFARKHEPRKSYISINESLTNTVELRAYDLNVNNIKGTLRLAPDLPRTMADFHQLQQVFLNLITNAEQAIKEAHGKGSLVIETRKVTEMIQITFADDGPGIPAANLDRVFEPFFTTKGIGQGTGLGLSICYGIIKEHGGRIYAESGEGEGATFVVELPVISDSSDCPAKTDRKTEYTDAGGERREMVKS